MNAIFALLGPLLAKVSPRVWHLLLGAFVIALISGWCGWKLHKPTTIHTGLVATSATVTPAAPQSGPADHATASTEQKIVYKDKPVPYPMHDTINVAAVVAGGTPETLQVHHIDLYKRFPRGDSVYVDISSQLLPMTLPADFRSEIDLQRAPDTIKHELRVDTISAHRLGLDLKLLGIGAAAGAVFVEGVRIFLKSP